jgi:hypothetical protein
MEDVIRNSFGVTRSRVSRREIRKARKPLYATFIIALSVPLSTTSPRAFIIALSITYLSTTSPRAKNVQLLTIALSIKDNITTCKKRPTPHHHFAQQLNTPRYNEIFKRRCI